MSFSQSRRFTYSGRVPEVPRENIKNCTERKSLRIEKKRMSVIDGRFIKDSLESLVVLKSSLENPKPRRIFIKSTPKKELTDLNSNNILYQKVVRKNPMSPFVISEPQVKNPIKKITSSIKNTIKNNIYPKNLYNVRKEEQKQIKLRKKMRNLSSTFTFEEFTSDLNKSDKSLNENNTRNGNETIRNIPTSINKLISKTNTDIKKMIQNNLIKIKDNSNQRFKSLMTEIMAFNMISLDEIQIQCNGAITDLNENLRKTLKYQSEQFANREMQLRNNNSALMDKLRECTWVIENMEDKYRQLLTTAERKMSEQEMLIESLKAELDAVELNANMERVFKKNSK